jgi:pyruvate/2-oxoglutarate dehydrogenase complex dihydrolipoamide acyltransferase (E2) component
MSTAYPLLVRLPSENVNDPTALLGLWMVADHTPVKEGEDIVEFETSKFTFTVQAPASGILRHRYPVKSDVLNNDWFAAITLDGILPESSSDKQAPQPPSVHVAADVNNVAKESATARPLTPLSAPAHDRIDIPFSPRFSQKAQALLQQYGLAKSLFDSFSLVTHQDVEAKQRALASN